MFSFYLIAQNWLNGGFRRAANYSTTGETLNRRVSTPVHKRLCRCISIHTFGATANWKTVKWNFHGKKNRVKKWKTKYLLLRYYERNWRPEDATKINTLANGKERYYCRWSVEIGSFEYTGFKLQWIMTIYIVLK